MKKFFKKLFQSIASLFKKIDIFAKNNVETAVIVVENIKNISENPSIDILTALIPGNIDDSIKDKLRTVLPVLLYSLKAYETCKDLEGSEKLRCIITQLNYATPEEKKIGYRGLASLIIEKLSDGKLTASECVHLAEYYYQEIYKKK